MTNQNSKLIWVSLIITIGLVVGLFASWAFANSSYGVVVKEISYSDFYKILEGKTKEIDNVRISGASLRGQFKDGSLFHVNIFSEDMDLLKLLRDRGVNVEIRPPMNKFAQLLLFILPLLLWLGFFILIIVFFIYFLRRNFKKEKDL